MKSQQKIELSIVITTKDRYHDLLDCIKSVINDNKRFVDWELIIIDDGSSDDTKTLNKILLSKDKYKIIHHKKSLGMINSRNEGLLVSSGDSVILIDDDNVIHPNMVNVLVDVAKNKSNGIVGATICYFDTKEKYFDYQKINLYTGRTRGHLSKKKRKWYSSDGVPNVFLIRRDVIKKCGLFDEALLSDYSEPDYSFNAKKYGINCVVADAAITYHKLPRVSDVIRHIGGHRKVVAYCLIRNRIIFVSRYGNFLEKMIFCTIFSFFWTLLYLLLALMHGRSDLIKVYLLGCFDGWLYVVTHTVHNSMPRDL